MQIGAHVDQTDPIAEAKARDTNLVQFFLGFRVTFAGSLIGLGYGFVLGFLLGFGVACLYNQLLGWRTARRDDSSP